MTGDKVLATTDSNPPSTFEWYDSARTDAFHTGHELTFESSMAGQVWMVVVKAANTVGKGEQRSTAIMIRFRVRGMYVYVCICIYHTYMAKVHEIGTSRV